MPPTEGRPGFLAGRVTSHYVGFWARGVATVLDVILLMLVITPLEYFVYGPAHFHRGPEGPLFLGSADLFFQFGVPAIVVLAFWSRWGATPGKMAIGARIVDATTRERPSFGQLLLRYVGYFPATLVLCLGILAVGWDRKKQGWHDKMASTVVISTRE